MASPDQPPKEICPTCNTMETGRNLVVALDGTSNKFGLKNSNVIELYMRIEKGKNQLTYYNSGIGTYANLSGKSQGMKWFINKRELAFAWNFQTILLAAYRWLSVQHKEGDRIFLFGFSRGAYQVRVLAAMIEAVGLIHSGNEEQIPFAYELYARSCKSSKKEDRDLHEGQKLAEHFKSTFSRQEVKVHFVGVWDTVSSIGVFRSKNMPQVNTVGHICYFRHALALDEKRVRFSPEDIYRGDEQHRQPAQDRGGEHVKEVWFIGSHSDVGGGIKQEEDRDIMDQLPVFWMLREARKEGLRTVLTEPEWDFDNIKFNQPEKSLKGFWYILEGLFCLSRREDFPSRPLRWILPHCGEPRYIYPNQKIHASYLYMKERQELEGRSTYLPLAQFYPIGNLCWDYLNRNEGKWNCDRIELDIYGNEFADEQVQQLLDENDVRTALLRLRAHRKGVPAFLKAQPKVFDVFLNAIRSDIDLRNRMSGFIIRMANTVEVKVAKIFDTALDEYEDGDELKVFETLFMETCLKNGIVEKIRKEGVLENMSNFIMRLALHVGVDIVQIYDSRPDEETELQILNRMLIAITSRRQANPAN